LVRTVFGLSARRPGQQSVIDAGLSKQRTLAITPREGKSRCYRVPAMLLPDDRGDLAIDPPGGSGMMDHISDSARSRPTTTAIDAAPLALAGVVAVAALATHLARPFRRSTAGTENHQPLVAYLRKHLGGADAAIHVVRRLAATHTGSEDGRLFRQLLKSSNKIALLFEPSSRRWAPLHGRRSASRGVP